MKKFIASYSGGKDSVLAIHRAIQLGYEPIMLVVTYNEEKGRSWFHGIPKEVLQDISKSIKIPIKVVRTNGDEYELNFIKALKEAKSMGADLCVFGDIDIENHKDWCKNVCEKAGIQYFFPLWQEDRKKLVLEFINSGYVANITVVNKEELNEKFVGEKLTEKLLEEIEKDGADVCGENGEYHTFVSDGPIFKTKLKFNFGAKIVEGNYAIMPILKKEENYKQFIHKQCEYFPCHEGIDLERFNCLFCFCPLYLKDNCIGNPKFLKNGVKDCSKCLVPHKANNYEKIINNISSKKNYDVN